MKKKNKNKKEIKLGYITKSQPEEKVGRSNPLPVTITHQGELFEEESFLPMSEEENELEVQLEEFSDEEEMRGNEEEMKEIINESSTTPPFKSKEQLEQIFQAARLYRAKPVVIEAVRISQPFKIETLEGTMLANAGDWIVKGTHGEFYPVKNEVFEAKYQETDRRMNPRPKQTNGEANPPAWYPK